jgi:hypothetical protein
MAEVAYEKDITGLTVIDPYNDFISEGGNTARGAVSYAASSSLNPAMLWPRTLVLQRARQHRSRPATREARHPQAHRRGAHRTHLRGGICSIRR